MYRNPYADLLVVLLIVLLIWGPKRLPGLGKQLGQGIRDFKDSITGRDEEPEEQAQITPGTSQTMTTEQRPADKAASERRS